MGNFLPFGVDVGLDLLDHLGKGRILFHLLFDLLDGIEHRGVVPVVEDLADYYVNKKIDKIEIITTRFKNMMSYFVEEWEILPLKSPEADYEKLHDNVAEPLMEFEPDMHNILQKVVPMYITNIIYQAMLEAQASELASRMTAMSAATSNAEKMITTLSIEYNKSRQAAITQEIVEVVSGANTQIN